MEDNRIPLRVLGISYSQVQTGVFALILAQTDGPYRIPVMIGAAEAQAIAMKIESVVPPRPLTHDLFPGIFKAFGIKLTEVTIYRFEDGIFYSELTLTDGDRTISIDSRTSDAVALAMRTGAPIYTTPEVLAETGFEMEEVEVSDSSASAAPDTGRTEAPVENYTIAELERTLADLIESEDYEEAARISAILKKKRDEQQDK
ncbi:MAG: bifunctional nuclease family protein [Muribaculaceae bacterium]|nr:bifunctional nuclease family protein [Muribaculaceae bacterium]